MRTPQERILIVENDPETGDVIGRQTLQPLGYRVQVVVAAAQAIQEAARFAPDVIIANLNLPGLSGKDLLVALSSQGIEVPVIVIATKELESDVIQAFRLGAVDYLRWPVREAEVVSAVERALKQVRSKSERETLSRQLKQTNLELQRRVRELTTIFAVGKAVTSAIDQSVLFDKIVEGAVYITEADCGWLLLRDERVRTFILVATRNLSKSISDKLNQPWDDGISSLVAMSGEALSIHGDPLQRFKVAKLGQSVLVVPVKVNKEVVGLMVVVRKSAQPFGASNQALLEAVADYASISLVNVRLFKALEDRARTMQQTAESSQVSERIKDELLQNLSQELRAPLTAAMGSVDLLAANRNRNLNEEQVENTRIAQDRLRQLADILELMTSTQQAEIPKQRMVSDLNDMARQAITRYQRLAHQGGLTLFTELSAKPVAAYANPVQIAKVLEGLLSNAIKYSPQGGQITVRVERTPDGQARLSVQDQGAGIDPKRLPNIFDRTAQSDSASSHRFGGLGISLALSKEIVNAHGGKIWVESKPSEGTIFHIMLSSPS
jgi:signal transduction histidine kinase/FixJ family two-component response regulator